MITSNEVVQFDFKDTFQKFFKNKKVILITLLISMSLAFFIGLLLNYMGESAGYYNGTIKLLFVPEEDNESQVIVVEELVSSDHVLNRTKINLDITDSLTSMQDNLEINSHILEDESYTTEFNISYIDTDLRRSKDIVNMLALQTIKIVDETMQVEDIRIIEEPSSINESGNINRINLFGISMLGLITGLTFSIMLIFASDYINKLKK